MTFTIKHAATAAAAAGALAVGLTATIPGAGADTIQFGASGNTTIQLTNQVISTLQSSGCGALSATSTGGGALVTTKAGKINVTFPITGVIGNPDDGNLRIVHAGSGVELQNSCYDVRLTNLYIQDFGLGDQTQTLDVLALTRNADGTDRELDFTLDLTSAKGTLKNSGNVKIRSLNVLLAQDGANQLNTLATGNTADEAGNVDGPFSTGEQIGKARTSIRLQQPAA